VIVFSFGSSISFPIWYLICLSIYHKGLKSRISKEVMMTKDVYERLAHHLDDLPGGFPCTESGVEMHILRRLFTPEDAELTLHLTLIPIETAAVTGNFGDEKR
jgi:hypothetical protein